MRWSEVGLWLAAGIWAVLAAWPATWWFDPGQVEVRPADDGALRVLFTGGPVRPFAGSYTVLIVEAATHRIVAEDRSGVFPYRTDRARPEPIALDWWAPGLGALPPGVYQMTTCWTVHDPWPWAPIVPDKTVCNESAPFVLDEERTPDA